MVFWNFWILGPILAHQTAKFELYGQFCFSRSMRRELQSQNHVNCDYEKTTDPIYLKFWQKFLLMSTTEIQK